MKIVSITTAADVHEPGSNALARHFSVTKGHNLTMEGSLLIISKGKSSVLVPLANVLEIICEGPVRIKE